MVSEQQKISTLDGILVRDALDYIEITKTKFSERTERLFELFKYGSPAFKVVTGILKKVGVNTLNSELLYKAFVGDNAAVMKIYEDGAEPNNPTEPHKWRILRKLLESACQRKSTSPEEELRQLKKDKQESWCDFVDRYAIMAENGEAEKTQQTKILYQKLPAKYRTVVCDLSHDCSLDQFMFRIRNMTYWEGSDSKASNEDRMEIDAIQEAHEIQEARAEISAKVVDNGRINYDAINSPGRVMVGAREICKNSKREAWNLLRYLQRLLEQDKPQNRQKTFQSRRPPQRGNPRRTYKTAVETCGNDEGPSQLEEIIEDFEEASQGSFPINAVRTQKKQKGVMKLPINVTSHLGYNRKVEGLVDTGAERSVISLGLVKELGLKIQKDESKLVFANGDSAKVTGKCTLKFRTTSAKTGPLKVDCLILPKPGYEFLIGMDFLKSQDISINPSSHTLTMNQATIRCFSAKNIPKGAVKNSVVEDVISTFTEKATHLPVVKEDKVTFPLNRSLVLGPKEVRMIKYPAVLAQKLIHKKSAIITPNFSVHIGAQLKDFTVLSLTNHKQEPIRLTPKTTIFEAPLLQGQEPAILLQDGTKVTLKRPGRKQPFHARQ